MKSHHENKWVGRTWNFVYKMNRELSTTSMISCYYYHRPLLFARFQTADISLFFAGFFWNSIARIFSPSLVRNQVGLPEYYMVFCPKMRFLKFYRGCSHLAPTPRTCTYVRARPSFWSKDPFKLVFPCQLNNRKSTPFLLLVSRSSAAWARPLGGDMAFFFFLKKKLIYFWNSCSPICFSSYVMCACVYVRV